MSRKPRDKPPMTAEEEDRAAAYEIEEETRQIKQKTDKEYDDTVDTTTRMVRMANETRSVGAQTMVALKEQEDQLDRIENKQEKIGNNLDEADKQLTILEKWFCCCFAKDSGKKIRISEETKKRRAEEAEMKSASSSTNTRKADGSPSQKDEEELTEGRSGRRERRERERNNTPGRDAREDQIDDNLLEVGDIVSDMLEQSKEMGSTLERQNEQLDRISKKVDKNSEHVQVATKRVNNVNTGLFAF